jgi:hypothetical protein
MQQYYAWYGSTEYKVGMASLTSCSYQTPWTHVGLGSRYLAYAMFRHLRQTDGQIDHWRNSCSSVCNTADLAYS